MNLHYISALSWCPPTSPYPFSTKLFSNSLYVDSFFHLDGLFFCEVTNLERLYWATFLSFYLSFSLMYLLHYETFLPLAILWFELKTDPSFLAKEPPASVPTVRMVALVTHFFSASCSLGFSSVGVQPTAHYVKFCDALKVWPATDGKPTTYVSEKLISLTESVCTRKFRSKCCFESIGFQGKGLHYHFEWIHHLPLWSLITCRNNMAYKKFYPFLSCYSQTETSPWLCIPAGRWYRRGTRQKKCAAAATSRLCRPLSFWSFTVIFRFFDTQNLSESYRRHCPSSSDLLSSLTPPLSRTQTFFEYYLSRSSKIPLRSGQQSPDLRHLSHLILLCSATDLFRSHSFHQLFLSIRLLRLRWSFTVFPSQGIR